MKKHVTPDSELIRWISQYILPHEADVRKWLRRSFRHHMEEDDTIQEAYCRIAVLSDFIQIRSGRAYFFTVVRHILLEQIRRERVIHIEALAEIDELSIVEGGASPERILSARQELLQVEQMLNQLPERCRMVFVMRKVQGLSQREVAQALSISENIIEKEVAQGMRQLLSMMARRDDAPSSVRAVPALLSPTDYDREKNRQSD